MVRSPDGDTQLFDITTGVLQGDMISPFLFIIYLYCVLRKAYVNDKHLGLTIENRKSIRYPETFMTDADYADDLASTPNNNCCLAY